MKILFPLLIFLSLFFGLLTGRLDAVASAALNSAADAVRLAFTLMGAVCLWSGMMEVADRAGLTKQLARLIAPLLRLIFGHPLPADTAEAAAANISANLLGLGNAATPLGLAAMEKFRRDAPSADEATDDMILFTVMNTSSLQLIPTTVAALRLAAGSESPMEILPAVWLVSVFSLAAALFAAKLFSRISLWMRSHTCIGGRCALF